MSSDYRNAGTVKKLSSSDDFGIFAEFTRSDCRNEFNNNIHFHSYYELEFLTEGSGRYEINNTVFDIRKGALFLTTPADYHTYSLTQEETIRLFNLQFYPALLSDTVNSNLYTQPEPIVFYLEGEQYDAIFERLQNIVRIFSQPQPMYDILLRNEIENLCITLLYMADQGKSALDEYSVVKKVIIYVKQNYRQHLTLEGIAEYVGLSKSYLSRTFSAATGLSLSAYIRGVRLDAAANLLKSTELSVKEISYKTGFRNTNYFTDSFCQKFGTSPREYRKTYRKSIGIL